MTYRMARSYGRDVTDGAAMFMTVQDVMWLIDRPVTGKVNDDDSITVTDGSREMTLANGSDGRLYFNGQFVDVGELFMEYVAVMDEVAEYGASEPIDQVTREMGQR